MTTISTMVPVFSRSPPRTYHFVLWTSNLVQYSALVWVRGFVLGMYQQRPYGVYAHRIFFLMFHGCRVGLCWFWPGSVLHCLWAWPWVFHMPIIRIGYLLVLVSVGQIRGIVFWFRDQDLGSFSKCTKKLVSCNVKTER